MSGKACEINRWIGFATTAECGERDGCTAGDARGRDRQTAGEAGIEGIGVAGLRELRLDGHSLAIEPVCLLHVEQMIDLGWSECGGEDGCVA